MSSLAAVSFSRWPLLHGVNYTETLKRGLHDSYPYPVIKSDDQIKEDGRSIWHAEGRQEMYRGFWLSVWKERDK